MSPLLVLVALATAPPVDTPLPLPTLVDECAVPADWSPPFAHVYRLRSGGTLVFVGVRHGDDAPTHALLRSTFAQFKPGFVLVEGVSAERSGDPAYLKTVADHATQRLQAGHLDEIATAIKLASDAGIPFAGWDRSPAQGYSASAAHGFALDDVLGAHLIRRRADPFDPASATAIQSELHFAAAIATRDTFDYAGWYRRTYGDRFVQANGTPCGVGIAATIVKFETAERNRTLIAVIGHRVRPGTVVLIEGGANHWLALSGWLRSISVDVS